MKLCRFNDDRIGIVRDGLVHDVTAMLDDLPPLRYPVPHGDYLISRLDSMREQMERLADKAVPSPIANVRFLSPVANPSKIIGVPANYRAHAEEAKIDKEISVYSAGKQRTIEEQGLFLKANSALIGPSEGVTLHMPERRTDHEAELGVVIGRRASNVSAEDALNYVAGYALALDMVVRGSEDRSFRKSLDSFAVLGPWLVTADEFGDPGNISFSLHINDELRQATNTAEMIIDIPKQIAWASSFYTLYPGDIIMTGTCAGVGPVYSGDWMHLECERIGKMAVPVRAAS